MVQTEQVRAELVAHAPQGVQAGQPLWLGLQLTHQPHWHTYWKNPGDSGLPTQLEWTLPPGLRAGAIAWPTPKKIAVGSLANFGFEGTTLLVVPIEVGTDFAAAGAREMDIRVRASWLVCREECIPQEGEFAIRIPIQGSSASHAAAFNAVLSAQPSAYSANAVARVSEGHLSLELDGLPSAWHGRPLGIFPETANLIESASAPDKALGSASGWSGSRWQGRMAVSGQREASPDAIPILVVLEDGATRPSLRAVVRVQGGWPAVSTSPGGRFMSAGELPKSNPNAKGPPTPAADASLTGLLWALLAAVLGGLILNLMPCVFPVLAIKVLDFARNDTAARQRRVQGMAYTAGVVLSFVALGGLMLALRAGGAQLGWGFQLQSPGVVAALALLFTLIGLNLAGQLDVGHWLPSNLASVQLRHPAADAFLSGVLAVAVASPCTAPFMGASLGLAVTLPAVQALAIFAALGLGLALPYLLASWLPVVARWLPRPGAWMDTLKRFMAFPMWATVVWLVWVLGHLGGIDAAASLLVLLLSVALLAWSLRLSGRSRHAFAALSVALCALSAWVFGPNVLQISIPSATAATSTDRWEAWVPGTVEAKLALGQPVFVDFTAAWCITCQVNKKTTLADSAVLQDFATKGVTLLRADWTQRDPAITQALLALGRNGVPVYVLYAPGRAPVVFSEILRPQAVRDALAAL